MFVLNINTNCIGPKPTLTQTLEDIILNTDYIAKTRT